MVYRVAPAGEEEVRLLYREHCRKLSRLTVEYGAMPMTTYGTLADLFDKAWCRETASPNSWGSWSPVKPSLGQCDVTALLVQTLCGGAITRTTVEGYGAHYANQLPNGEGVSLLDLTRIQFPYEVQVFPGVPVERSLLLESRQSLETNVRERYELLRQRFATALYATNR